MRNSLPTRASSQSPRPILDDGIWQHYGRCRDQPADIFFPEDLTRGLRRANEERAKVICRSCPVLTQCREHALRAPESYGIWGALTPRERAGAWRDVASGQG